MRLLFDQTNAQSDARNRCGHFFAAARLAGLSVVMIIVLSASAVAQSSEGDGDLDKAFDAKIKAQSTRDLDKVVELCETAIEKGLDEEGVEQAQQLAASALYEHAEQLTKRIFASAGRDRRWKMFRSQALSRLEKATELQPKMGPAWLLIARLHGLEGGDRNEARMAIEKAVELAGDDRQQLSESLFLRASLADDGEDRLGDLNQAIQINPQNIDAVRARGAWYLKNQQPEKALEDLRTWLASDADNTKNYLAVAQSLMVMGEKFDENLQAEAIKILEEAVEKNPDDPEPYTLMAKIRLFQEDSEKAFQDVEAALKLDPKHIESLMLKTALLVDDEKWESALDTINGVLEIEPYSVRAIQMRSQIYTRLEQFDKAIEDVKLLSDNNPQNIQIKRQLAMLYSANDQPRRAVRVYDRLLERMPTEAWEDASEENQLVLMELRSDLLQGRGNAYLSTGEHADAIRDYEESVDLINQIREAEEDAEVPEEERFQPYAGVFNNLAWVLATSPEDDLRDGQRAIDLAIEAAELTEYKEAYILSTLASGYAETGDFEKATEWIEKAIEVNNQDGEDAESDAEKKKVAEQQESLQKERASYVEKKPWREKQDVEADKAQADDDDDGDSEQASPDSSEPSEDNDSSEQGDADAVPDADESVQPMDSADSDDGAEEQPQDEDADPSADEPVPDSPETPEAPDSPEEPVEPDSSDTPEVPEAPEVPEEPDTPDVSFFSQII